MYQRSRDLLVLGLFLVVVGNSVVGWIHGNIDLTLVTTSCIGLMGLLLGAKPWERRDKDPEDDDNKDDR